MTASPHRQIPQFIPFAEAARLLSPIATQRMLRTYRDRKWLRAFKVGRVWHTTADDIEALRERIWQQGSGSTAQTDGTARQLSPDSPRTAGTSSIDSKTSAAPGRNASEQLAAALSSALKRKGCSENISSPAETLDQAAPVIRLHCPSRTR